MQDLTKPTRIPKRKVTTVLMSAPPAQLLRKPAEKSGERSGNEREIDKLREELREEREKSANLREKCSTMEQLLATKDATILQLRTEKDTFKGEISRLTLQLSSKTDMQEDSRSLQQQLVGFI